MKRAYLLLITSVICSICDSKGVPCNEEFGVDLSDGVITEEGTETIVTDNDGVAYSGDNLIYANEEKTKIIGCVCNVRTCVRKCCPTGQYLFNQTTCAATASLFNTLPILSTQPYHIIHGNKCGAHKKRALLYPDEFLLRSDGKLQINATGESFDVTDYCVDYILDEEEVKALLCTSEEAVTHANIVGMIISMPFLLTTFIVYILLPDRNLHAKSLMCYVITLFGAYFLLVVIQLRSSGLSDDDATCYATGIFCLLFFMVSFFWMNVISIDIWWTFSGLRGFSGSKRETQRKRFILYSAYAWGVPSLLVLLVTSLTFGTDESYDKWYYPGIGNGQCWFTEGLPTLLYFYGPMAIIIISNVALFGTTAWKICHIQQETKLLRKDNNKKHNYENDKQRFKLYLKLLLAMGINWSMEIISWAVNWQFGAAPAAVWYLTDFCNALYGVFIFFIFVFKKNIWILLKKRYYIFMGKPQLAKTLTVREVTSSPRTTVSSVGTKGHTVKYSGQSDTVNIS